MPKSVVVILFDALSYSVVFREGEVLESLPNLRALAEQSLVFHNAQSSPTDTTIVNVPHLLTGQKYMAIKLDSQGREVSVLENNRSQPVVLRDQRNIFDLAHEQGYRLVVFGYHLRYCSTYVRDKGYCQSTSVAEVNSEPQSIVPALLEIYRLAAAKTLPTSLSYKLEGMVGTKFLSLIQEKFLQNHYALLPLLKNPEGRFIYAHYPIPHTPYVRLNPETRGLYESGATYSDSLKAVDFFLGDILHALQESGVWEETLLIVLSDHNAARVTDDVRVPLIIKLPYKSQHMDFEGLWTHAQFLPLLEELFRGRSFDPDAVMAVVQALAPAQ